MATGTSSQHTLTLTVPQAVAALPTAGQPTPMGGGAPDPSPNPGSATGGGTPAAQPIQPEPSQNPGGQRPSTSSTTQPTPSANPGGGYTAAPTPGDHQTSAGGSDGGGESQQAGPPALPPSLSRVTVPFWSLREDLAAARRAMAGGENLIGAFRAMRNPYSSRYSRAISAMRGSGLIDEGGKSLQAFEMDDDISGEVTTVLPNTLPTYAAKQRYQEKVNMLRMGAMVAVSAASGIATDYYSEGAFTDERMAGSSLRTVGIGAMATGNPYAVVGGALAYGAGSIMGINAEASERGLSRALAMAQLERPGAISLAARGLTDRTGAGVQSAISEASTIGAQFGFKSGESVYNMTQLDVGTGLAGAGSADATRQSLALAAQGIGPGVQAYLRAQVGMNVGMDQRAAATNAAVGSAYSGATALGLTGDRATEYMSRMGSYAQGQNELGIGFTDKNVADTARFSANLGNMGGIPTGYALSATTSLMSTARGASKMLDVGQGLGETSLLAAAAAEGGSWKDIKKRLRSWSNDPYKALEGVKSQLGTGDAAYAALSSIAGDEAAEKMLQGVSKEELKAIAPESKASDTPVMTAAANAEMRTFVETLKAMNTNMEKLNANIEERARGTRNAIEAGVGASADRIGSGKYGDWRDNMQAPPRGF